MNAWKVFLNGHLVDVVFYDKNCDAKYVRDSLVEHDNYPTNILVKAE